MNSSSHSNALLVELLIVVMFFLLTTTTLLEVFAKAHEMSVRSEVLTVSLVKAQNTADRLYAADDTDAVLESLGFVKEDGIWTIEEELYKIEAVVTSETDEAGVFRRQEVRVISNGEQIYSLPCSRWEVEP